jgi:hypothetical protein
MSYSVASILATLKHYNIPASHYSFDIQKFVQTPEGYIPIDVIIDTDEIINYLKKFSYIAFGIARWSETFTYMLIKKLDDYKGKIVVGGYEITALKEDNDITNLITKNLNIHHFIQGYAEKPLVKLIKGEYSDDKKFLSEKLDEKYLFSPYSIGVLNTYSRKIYWETQRGCNSNCGFCEWGNAQVGSIPLNPEIIERDIEIFSKSNIEGINILDATFNIGKNYMGILENLIKKTTAKITFQARFEFLKPEFIKFCATYKERLHLEFGLQTIHENEMKVIGRKNDMNSIKDKLKLLNQLSIEYEVSIIYAIPGQNVSTFIDTIEFLRVNGCEKIMAYPLQIPRNSELDNKKREYKIKLKDDIFYVKSVNSCYSFSNEERHDMDCIAFSLAHEDKSEGLLLDHLIPIKDTQYQYEFPQEFIQNNRELLDRIISETFCRFEFYSDCLNDGKVEAIAHIKGAFRMNTTGLLDYALGKQPYYSKNSEDKWTYYKTVIGKSGYIYVFRDSRKEKERIETACNTRYS